MQAKHSSSSSGMLIPKKKIIIIRGMFIKKFTHSLGVNLANVFWLFPTPLWSLDGTEDHRKQVFISYDRQSDLVAIIHYFPLIFHKWETFNL